jgi:uncharacterized DUF497 family protein
MQFDWDEHNIAHIWRHRVLPEEAEQAVTVAPLEVDFQIEEGEERVQILGLTARGRLLSAFFTERYDKIRS